MSQGSREMFRFGEETLQVLLRVGSRVKICTFALEKREFGYTELLERQLILAEYHLQQQSKMPNSPAIIESNIKITEEKEQLDKRVKQL